MRLSRSAISAASIGATDASGGGATAVSGSRCATRDVPISRSGNSLSVFPSTKKHMSTTSVRTYPSTNLTTLFATALLPMSMSTSKKLGREWYRTFRALPTMSGFVPTARCTTHGPSATCGMSFKRASRYS